MLTFYRSALKPCPKFNYIKYQFLFFFSISISQHPRVVSTFQRGTVTDRLRQNVVVSVSRKAGTKRTDPLSTTKHLNIEKRCSRGSLTRHRIDNFTLQTIHSHVKRTNPLALLLTHFITKKPNPKA